ncbi:MAG: diguanylate cyclase [Gammaproteobacteria bacterium]|nr:diguanylate cyclase [Gammaproteobacteria bacterium]
MTDRYSFSSKEIDDALSVLNQAIENHLNWYIQLHEGLLCKQPFLETIIHPAAHTKCQLGRWYYGEAGDAIHSNPEFKALEASHKTMHDEARELVEAFQSFNEVELSKYRRLSEKQQELMKLLVSLRDGIIGQQHSFDPLTGLINRKSIRLILEKNHAQSLRYNSPYAIAMLDIDFFKSINDTHGHLGGDEVLKALSRYLSSTLRDSDSISRYGGEEFLILLPNSTRDISFKILERIREGISQLSIRFENADIKLTVSIGFSCFEARESVSNLIKHADAALYVAKSEGRNKVVVYDSAMKPGP